MQRTVTARMTLDIPAEARLLFGIAVAEGPTVISETMRFAIGKTEFEPEARGDVTGTRLHEFLAGPGIMNVEYRAVVEGQGIPEPVTELDSITYLRPSRYCPSDILTPVARELFSGLEGHAALAAVVTWVRQHLSYVPGSSVSTDGAEQTYLSRTGVCRDYAHLVIAFLRALDIPARMAAVYAPGLSPMDFHAVVEAAVDGEWWLVDATGLAPRQSMLRMSTGRDAADVAFLTNTLSDLELTWLEVTATVDSLPYDDSTQLVQLG